VRCASKLRAANCQLAGGWRLAAAHRGQGWTLFALFTDRVDGISFTVHPWGAGEPFDQKFVQTIKHLTEESAQWHRPTETG